MEYLAATYYFDYDQHAIQSLRAQVPFLNTGSMEASEQSRCIYTFVRDTWKYDPYTISLAKENYRASKLISRSTANCVEKSIILIALLRAVGIPARLHLGKVKNHLAVERLVERFGSAELTPHGMVDAFLHGQWLKLSPAFNASLCAKFNVPPLEFDGHSSSYLQAFNAEGEQFMEYVDDYGHFPDVPLEFMRKLVKTHYPQIFAIDSEKTSYHL